MQIFAHRHALLLGPTFDHFAVGHEQAHRRLHAADGLDRALVDGRDFAVQDKQISEQFGDMAARHSIGMDEAQAWLFSPLDAAPAIPTRPAAG